MEQGHLEIQRQALCAISVTNGKKMHAMKRQSPQCRPVANLNSEVPYLSQSRINFQGHKIISSCITYIYNCSTSTCLMSSSANSRSCQLSIEPKENKMTQVTFIIVSFLVKYINVMIMQSMFAWKAENSPPYPIIFSVISRE